VSDARGAVRLLAGRLIIRRAELRLRGLSLLAALPFLPACLGLFGNDGSSVSLGVHSKGALLHGVPIPYEGAGYQIHPDWRPRNHRYATFEVARWLTNVFRDVERTAPGSVAHLGDLSARSGGDAAMHRSHESGRDIDLFYFANDGHDRPVDDLPAMLHFAADGRAEHWSVGRAGHIMREPVPEAHFDARRNWALVRAMLTHSEVEVQWIFVHRALAALMIAQAEREGAPAVLLERARAVLHQPTDSQPHDDHMHVRVFCDPGDRPYGCNDKGPRRWLKKHWKYMPPAEGVAIRAGG
jgi:penicillin-insensitive murein DD-endopeptidase